VARSEMARPGRTTAPRSRGRLKKREWRGGSVDKVLQKEYNTARVRNRGGRSRDKCAIAQKNVLKGKKKKKKYKGGRGISTPALPNQEGKCAGEE